MEVPMSDVFLLSKHQLTRISPYFQQVCMRVAAIKYDLAQLFTCLCPICRARNIVSWSREFG